MENPGYIELLNSLAQQGDDRWRLSIPENWMQGRTTYGGLSAALCLEATVRQQPELPALRSAQISFIGPAGGPVEIASTVVRQGKSTSFVEATIHGEKGLATHSLFCFGAARDSKFNLDFTKAPICPDVENSEDFFKFGPGPAFTQNFECRLARGGRPLSGSDQNEHYIWIRFKEDVPTSSSALLAIGDMPPPAVLPMIKEFAPISSINWTVNFVDDAPRTDNGWWLMRTCAETAKQGYSSQDMQVWNTDRKLVMTGRQSVAVFY